MSIRSQEALLSLLEGYGLQTGEHLTSGNIFYVDSGAAGAADVASQGKAWETPFATLDFAISQCAGGQNDVVYLAPGHTETITVTSGSLLTLDVAGVSVIGLGIGSERPTFSIGKSSVTTAIVNVDGNNVTLQNLIIKPAGANAAILVDVDGTDCIIADCYFDMDVGSYEALIGVDIGASATRCRVQDCTFISTGSAGANSGIKLSGTVAYVEIIDCKIIGDFGDACIHNPTANVATNLLIRGCTLKNDATGDHCIELVSACTGLIMDNRLDADTVGAILDPGSCSCFGNLASSAVDVAGTPIPTVPGDTIGAQQVAISSQLAMDGGTIADTFTVTGPVLLDGLIMHITEAVSAHACAISWKNNVTVGAEDTPLCGTVDINAFAIADDIFITGDGGTAAQKADAATICPLLCDTPVVLFAGTIIYDAANSTPTSGIADVYMIYRPLAAGAKITAT